MGDRCQFRLQLFFCQLIRPSTKMRRSWRTRVSRLWGPGSGEATHSLRGLRGACIPRGGLHSLEQASSRTVTGRPESAAKWAAVQSHQFGARDRQGELARAVLLRDSGSRRRSVMGGNLERQGRGPGSSGSRTPGTERGKPERREGARAGRASNRGVAGMGLRAPESHRCRKAKRRAFHTSFGAL